MNRKYIKQVGVLLLTLSLMSGCAQTDINTQTDIQTDTQGNTEMSSAESVSQENLENEFSLETQVLSLETDTLKIHVDLPLVKLGDQVAIEATRVVQKPIKDALNQALTSADFWSVKDASYEKKSFTGGFEIVYEDDDLISIKPVIEDHDHLMPITFVKKSGYRLDYSSLPKANRFWDLVDEASVGVLTELVEVDVRPQVYNHFYVTDTQLVFFIPQWYVKSGEMNAQETQTQDANKLSVKLDDLNLVREDFTVKASNKIEIASKQHVVSKAYYTFAGEIPVFSSEEMPAFADELSALMDTQIVMNEKLIEDDALTLYESNKEDGFIYPPEIHNVQFDVMRNDSEYLSLYLTYYSYTGGAHGMHYDVAYNFDLQSGNRVYLKDLFKTETDYVSLINRELHTQIDNIQETFIDKNGEGWVPYMGFDTIAEDQHFYLTQDSLVIFFDLYEIAPYASGIPTFEIPLSKFDGSFK